MRCPCFHRLIEQLIAQKTYADCLQFLGEKGWGDTEAGVQDAETILNRELEKTWTLVKEMVSDQTVFDVLLIQDSFHNLKAAIKTVVDGEVQANIFYDNASVSGEALVEIIKDKDFRSLPESMRECALEAYECLVHTGDGQMCDVIIDRAAMRAMLAAAEKNGDALLKEYAETVVAVANSPFCKDRKRTGFYETCDGGMSDAQCGTADAGSTFRYAGCDQIFGRNTVFRWSCGIIRQFIRI